jgi:hypothetical protein
MKRRDLLAGLGGVTAASSLLVGSGAFTSVEAEREFDVNIVDDNNNAFASADIPKEVVVSSYRIDEDNPSSNNTANADEMDYQATVWTGGSSPASAGDYGAESDSDLDPDTVAEESSDGEHWATVEDDDGLMRVENRIAALIEAEIDTDREYIDCFPDRFTPQNEDGEATITGGELARFNASADCKQLSGDGETIDVTTHVNRNASDSVSASIQREVKISREVWIAVVFSCTDARVSLATDRDQPGEHLRIEPPIDVEATVVDGSDSYTETATLWEIDELPWEPQRSYDKVERLEIEGEENDYTFENTLTEILEEGSHSGWQCNKNWTGETL